MDRLKKSVCIKLFLARRNCCAHRPMLCSQVITWSLFRATRRFLQSKLLPSISRLYGCALVTREKLWITLIV